MAPKSIKTKTKRRRTIFSLEAPDANQVLLGGDLNQWKENAHPMKKDDSGVWKKTLVLPPGRFEYKFLVDGRWRNDPKNVQTCANCFGTYNNVLVIS